MKPARFDYARPQTVRQAAELLAQHGADAAILAGGQSLVPMMNLRLATPRMLVDIGRVAGLGGIERIGDRLSIGAMACHADLLASPLVRQHAPLVALALPFVAHAAIRNRGTLGGSLALADPAAELPACMVCLDAEIRLASLRGERAVPARDFFRGLYTTDRAADEIVVSVTIPALRPGWRFAFDEVARRRGDFAVAGLAFGARIESGRAVECRVAFCGVEDAPRRLPSTEACVAGGGALAEAGRIAMDELAPASSEEYPAAYRRRLAATLLARARIDA